MFRTRKVVSAALIAVAAFVASCDQEPHQLPDIASDLAANHNILLNHVEEHGGPPRTFGPFSSLTAMDMFAACLGGGKMTLSNANEMELWGACNGERIGGLRFDSGSGTPRCITMTIEGEVTAWEVVITEVTPFDDRPAPGFFTPPAAEPGVCAAG